MTRRSTPVVAILAVVTLFAFLHSGARGVEVCHREGAGGPGTLSLWPPGTTCIAGEPERTYVDLHPAFVFAAIGLVLLVIGLPLVVRALRGPRRA